MKKPTPLYEVDPPAERRRLLFQVDETRYDFLRTLEHRQNGDVLMLAERHERHGLRGQVAIKCVRALASKARRHRLYEELARLISDASAMRDEVKLPDERLFG